MSNNAIFSEPLFVRPSVVGVEHSQLVTDKVAWSVAAVNGLHCSHFAMADTQYVHACLGAVVTQQFALAKVHQYAVPVIRLSLESAADALDSYGLSMRKGLSDSALALMYVQNVIDKTAAIAVAVAETTTSSVTKTGTEHVSFYDSSAMRVQRGVRDTATVAERAESEVNKTTAIAVAVAETTNSSVTKTGAEHVSFYDSSAMRVRRGVRDTATVAERAESEVAKTAREPATVVDGVGSEVCKTSAETCAASDAASSAVSKQAAEAVSTTDTRACAFTKVVLEALAVSDTIELVEEAITNSSDTVALGDSSSARVSKSAGESVAVVEQTSLELLAASSASFGNLTFGLSGFGA